MRYIMALLLAVGLAHAGEPLSLDCHQEILAWCKTYPGPAAEVDCEKMAHDECGSQTPPPKAELCKLRAKRLCAEKAEAERDACMSERLKECSDGG